MAHPFLQRRLASTLDEVVFHSLATGALNALVADHVVQSNDLPWRRIPGAGAACCAARIRAAGAAELSGVFFLQPLLTEAAGVQGVQH